LFVGKNTYFSPQLFGEISNNYGKNVLSTLFMKKKILVFTALIVASATAFGQQDIALTHFIYNKMAVNPGATGIEEGMCGNLIYRNQWDKVNGAPNSALFNGEMNMHQWWSGGLGLNVVHDAIGFNRQNNVNLNYSHHFQLGGGTLGVGLGIGIMSFGMNPTWVPPSTLNDPSLPGSTNAITLDANFGLFYQSTDFYVGLSSTHLPAPVLTGKALVGTGNVQYNEARHYYGMGGYTFRGVGSPDGDIDVQALLQTDLIKFSTTITARYMYRNKMYGGLGFRNSDAISVMLGYRFLDKMFGNTARMFAWAGYSYDLSVGQISTISRGTNELAVKLCYIPVFPITKSKHPRWL
jgi:type IX secretion system PorP/SprF family membrane protein